MKLNRLKDQSGASAVEFAIIAPVFLFLIAGMIAYGIYFGAAHSVQQVAAEAARASVAGLDDEERGQLAGQAVEHATGGEGLLQTDQITVEVSSDPERPGIYVVSVSYNAAHLPIWDLGIPLPVPERTIRRTSTIRVGGV